MRNLELWQPLQPEEETPLDIFTVLGKSDAFTWSG